MTAKIIRVKFITKIYNVEKEKFMSIYIVMEYTYDNE